MARQAEDEKDTAVEQVRALTKSLGETEKNLAKVLGQTEVLQSRLTELGEPVKKISAE